ncbi:hypothetical protein [Streptomyces sp. S.PNR 29]|uniref:hypothetical protein n=1 Tax=Streptomyces sp. S.PNR 29 TaxID=2973805 RepID=UPI0025B044FE|nr:hypothetical protein [Streptomyces sp. S.PNR 29]MDN0195293.1 hypothetical protein [Streptomyces sp. S.PNR 29]
MSATETNVETKAETQDPAGKEEPRGGDRSALVVGAAVLAACLGLVLFGVLGGLGEEDRPERRVPTAAVTYEVTGEGRVEVSYLARSEAGRATVEKNVELPWKKTVRVPLGKPPTVNIVLDGKGGQARCALAVRGKHVQSATASGAYGRATCSAELPAPERTTESTG